MARWCWGFWHSFPQPASHRVIPDTFMARPYIAVAIVSVWAASFIGSALSQNFTGFEVATPVMVIAVPLLLKWATPNPPPIQAIRPHDLRRRRN